MDFEKLGAFYLGRPYDLATGQLKPGLTLYDSSDLVTHAVCVGMTGSGKTGLCLCLLEEAAIDGVPAIAIDPKGDLGNLLLTFPDLRAEDFRAVGRCATRRGARRMTPEQFAAAQADLWRKGLAEWGQDGDADSPAARRCRVRDLHPRQRRRPSRLDPPVVLRATSPRSGEDDELLRERVDDNRLEPAGAGGRQRRSAAQPRAHPALDDSRPSLA